MCLRGSIKGRQVAPDGSEDESTFDIQRGIALPYDGVAERQAEMNSSVRIDKERIAEFCRRRKITELALFGSVLRGDFSGESDVDVLVTFAPEAEWSLFDLAEMQDELKAIFGREVDLVEKPALRNPFRRHHILRNREIVYAA